MTGHPPTRCWPARTARGARSAKRSTTGRARSGKRGVTNCGGSSRTATPRGVRLANLGGTASASPSPPSASGRGSIHPTASTSGTFSGAAGSGRQRRRRPAGSHALPPPSGCGRPACRQPPRRPGAGTPGRHAPAGAAAGFGVLGVGCDAAARLAASASSGPARDTTRWSRRRSPSQSRARVHEVALRRCAPRSSRLPPGCGPTVPVTMITNEPDAVRRFAARGKTVLKMLGANHQFQRWVAHLVLADCAPAPVTRLRTPPRALEAWVRWAMIGLMTHRLAPAPGHKPGMITFPTRSQPANEPAAAPRTARRSAGGH